ncbi:tetratricopeptide repeat protein [Alteromonas facilis]|uniref:tetratricopeptide repeat protein n=1 Tax=Alteromonas facilis TaxID=2048004 RepID=UPI000C2850F5|nr:tetratricopeptide repeat protein [Alteromonas facilis]
MISIKIHGCIWASLFFFSFAAAAEKPNKVLQVSNSALDVLVGEVQELDSVLYFQNKQDALRLCKSGVCNDALPLLSRLTQQFNADGDTWYLLGNAYRQAGNYEAAASALVTALELGTKLRGIPNGASNPNDLMVIIAEVYAQANNKALAQHWLTKALDFRWDDKPKLSGHSLFQKGKNPYFKPYYEKDWYKSLSGIADMPDNRVEGWRLDLNYLLSEIKRLHVAPFHSISEPELTKKAKQLYDEIPNLSDHQIVFGLMELLGNIGNGHNFIIPAWGKLGNFQQLPVQFYQFADGLYVVKASDEYQHLVGTRVLKFNEMDANKALRLTDIVNPRDNNMQRLWLGPYYLSLPEVLEGIGAIDNPDTVTLTLMDRQENLFETSLNPVPMSFSGFPKLPAVTGATTTPLYLKQNNDEYWREWLEDESILYVQFNDVRNKRSVTFDKFNQQLQSEIKDRQSKALVLDLRHNSGGDGSITPPMLKTLVLFEALNPSGATFVIVGRNTFSAGHDLLMNVVKITNAVVVGEPSGTRPNTIGEAGWFYLPYSGQIGIISSQFHQKGSAEDHRIWIAPSVPVALTSQVYFAGVDPAMESIKEIIKLRVGQK